MKETISGTEYSRATITNASGNAVRNEASTHFDGVERLSAGELENQNEAKLRSGYKVIDSMYIGQDESETIDLSDVFGADRQAIVPDNNNVEATFFIAKRIDGNNAETNAHEAINDYYNSQTGGGGIFSGIGQWFVDLLAGGANDLLDQYGQYFSVF